MPKEKILLSKTFSFVNLKKHVYDFQIYKSQKRVFFILIDKNKTHISRSFFLNIIFVNKEALVVSQTQAQYFLMFLLRDFIRKIFGWKSLFHTYVSLRNNQRVLKKWWIFFFHNRNSLETSSLCNHYKVYSFVMQRQFISIMHFLTNSVFNFTVIFVISSFTHENIYFAENIFIRIHWTTY